MKVLLVDRLQQHRDRPLKDLVLEGRHADRTRTAPVAFRNVHATHRWCAIRARAKSSEQRREVILEVPRVLCRRLPVHAYRCVFARAPVRLAQPLHVDGVVQRRERTFGMLPRELRYPRESR